MRGADLVDQKLEEAGGFGRFQLLHVSLLFLTSRCSYIWQTTAIVFTGYNINHHCTIPNNKTKDEWIPQIVGPDGDLMYDQCHHYISTSRNETIACDNGWTYNPEAYHPTHGSIVMEWDLVCSRKSLVEISIICMNMGCLSGFFLWGPLADRFGRRLAYFLSIALLAVSGTTTAFATNIAFFCTFCFVTGLASAGNVTQGTVLSLEMLPRRLVPLVGPVASMTASIAQMLLAFCSHFINHWRYLQLTLSLICVAFLVYYWWCPESPLWLWEKHRRTELDNMLSRIAVFNKLPKPSAMINASPQHNKGDTAADRKDVGVLRALHDFLRRPRLVLYLLVSSFLAFVTYSAYFGLVYIQGSLTGSVQLNLVLYALLGALGVLISMLLLRKFGRRPTEALFLTFYGSFMLASASSAYINSVDSGTLATVFTMAAKAGEVAATSVFNFYSLEFFPTNIRSTAAGFQVSFGYIGSVLAPFLSMTLIRIAVWIPGVIYGLLALLAAALTFLLPETKDRALPSSAAEVESWTRSRSAAKKMDPTNTTKTSATVETCYDKVLVSNDDYQVNCHNGSSNCSTFTTSTIDEKLGSITLTRF